MVNVKKTLYYTSILHLFSFRLFFTIPLIEPNPNVQSLLEKEFGEPKPSWKKERSVEYAPESKGLSLLRCASRLQTLVFLL